MNRPAARSIASLAIAIAACALVPGASADDPSKQTFVIRAGNHRVEGEGLGLAVAVAGRRVDRRLSFSVRFAKSCAYRTADARNQGDWNKLMGITTLDIHGDSVRLGWRWLPGEERMELGLYAYLAGRRAMRPLAKVELDRWADVELRLHAKGVQATAGQARTAEARSPVLADGTATWILRTAYFGGDETAPHDVTIDVRNVVAR